jgi:predicted RNA-binding Zn-ribbon protein involved in translation (DUF1610 family)
MQDGEAAKKEMRCPICQWPLEDGEADVRECPECGAGYHGDCWEENGGCGVYGCSQVPETEHLKAVEIPAAYWGNEKKQCPSCGEEILAAAIRCRNCGATFSTEMPIDENQFNEQEDRRRRRPVFRKRSVALFVLCLIPFTAPFAALFGSIWYRVNRRHINKLPSTYPALCKIGLAVAFAQVAVAIVAIAMTSFGSLE